MRASSRFATLLSLGLAAASAGCIAEPEGPDAQSSNVTAAGNPGDMFAALEEELSVGAAEDGPIAGVSRWIPNFGDGYIPNRRDLVDALHTREVDLSVAGASIDGAFVGSDQGECFFAQRPKYPPSEQATYYMQFLSFRPRDGRVSDLHGQPIEGDVDEFMQAGEEPRTIIYVNGVNTDAATHCATAQMVADLSGAIVFGVMNESDGMLADLWQAGWDRFSASVENILTNFGVQNLRSSHENPASMMLTNVILQRLRLQGTVEVWAHSQGGAITSLSMYRALRAAGREGLATTVEVDGGVENRVKVVTFASAGPKWPDGPEYTHFVHMRDAVPATLGVGAFGDFITLGKKRAGAGATMHFLEGEPGAGPFALVAEDEAESGFTDLHPLDYHGISDVYFPAYEQVNGSWTSWR